MSYVVYVGIYLGYSPKGSQFFPLNFQNGNFPYQFQVLTSKATGNEGEDKGMKVCFVRMKVCFVRINHYMKIKGYIIEITLSAMYCKDIQQIIMYAESNLYKLPFHVSLSDRKYIVCLAVW